MTIAWLLMAHHKPRQFARLFAALDHPRDRFLLHVDRKAAADVHDTAARLADGRSNVHVMPSMALAWGGWSLAAVQLEAIRLLLGLDGGWRHFVNLSGQDFPLRPVDAIREALAAEPDRNHVSIAPIDSYPDRAHLRRRRRYLRFERDGRVVGTPFPKLRWHGVRVEWKGSGWWCLTRSLCEWIVRDPVARECIRALRHCYVPDEFLMQTLAMNGPFAATLSGDDRREVLWNGGAHPVTLTMRDRDRLLASSAHFARKFDEDLDARILDLLAQRIGAAPRARVLSRELDRSRRH